MKKFRILLLTLTFIVACVGTVWAENYANVTFQKSQSYELADVITLFAPPPNENELSWLGISYSKNFKYLYRVDDIPRYNKQFCFGGVLGLVFNNNDFKSTDQYWEDGILKESSKEVGGVSRGVCKWENKA